MKIRLENIKVRDLVKNYVDNQEEGIRGFGGILNIRPAYQRAFVYNNKQRNSVIEWVKATFGEKNYRKEMLGLNWGDLYNRYHANSYDAAEVEVRVNELMANEEVTDKKGVYEYILSGENEDIACKLSKRLFSEADKRTAYERQNGICPITGEHLDIKDMQADHIIPWWKGGATILSNLQMISKSANQRKSGK